MLPAGRSLALLTSSFRRSTKLRLFPLVGLFLTVTSLLLMRPGSLKAAADYRMSWVAESSTMAGQDLNGKAQSMPDFIYSAIVQPDGTIWTDDGWNEGGDPNTDFKDGKIIDSHQDEHYHNLNHDSSRSVQDKQGRTWKIQNSTFVGGDSVCQDSTLR